MIYYLHILVVHVFNSVPNTCSRCPSQTTIAIVNNIYCPKT